METTNHSTPMLQKGYIILIDVEIYDRNAYREYRSQSVVHLANHGGSFIFEGFSPEIIRGDWKPRNILIILHFEKPESFQKFWISGEHRSLLNKYKEAADFKIVQITSC